MTTEVRDTSPAPDPRIPPLLSPGLVTGTGDDYPSGIATLNMNRRYGLRTLTVLLLAYPVTAFWVPEPWAISSSRG